MNINNLQMKLRVIALFFLLGSLSLSAQQLKPVNGYLAGKGIGAYERDTVLELMPKTALMEKHKGVIFGFLARNGYYSSKEGLAQIDEMYSAGVRWVGLTATMMQETVHSTRVYNDYEYSPSDAELELIIKRIHEKGMRVMLYTDLEMHDSQWRGRVQFFEANQIENIKVDYWGKWFDSYTKAMVNYARIAQRNNVEMICVGAEMNGTVNQEAHWNKLIDQVRKEYTGVLIYETLDIDLNKIPKWYSKLDLIGFSFYLPISDKPKASKNEQLKYVQKHVELLKKFSEIVGKPLIFTEIGSVAVENASLKPWDRNQPSNYDGEEQAQYLEVVLEAFWNEPWWKGAYWWKWDEQQIRPAYYTDPIGAKDFTIKGKPALKIMKKWYSK